MLLANKRRNKNQQKLDAEAEAAAALAKRRASVQALEEKRQMRKVPLFLLSHVELVCLRRNARACW